MILCNWRGNWFLGTGITKDGQRCYLRCGPRMPHPPDFKPLPPVGAVVYGSTDELDAVTFFPSVHYRGYRVDLWNFDPEREEPLLKCHIDPSELGGKGGMDVVRQLIDELKGDGWLWDMREGGTKYVHVDDLEKVEGPPPSGAF